MNPYDSITITDSSRPDVPPHELHFSRGNNTEVIHLTDEDLLKLANITMLRTLDELA